MSSVFDTLQVKSRSSTMCSTYTGHRPDLKTHTKRVCLGLPKWGRCVKWPDSHSNKPISSEETTKISLKDLRDRILQFYTLGTGRRFSAWRYSQWLCLSAGTCFYFFNCIRQKRENILTQLHKVWIFRAATFPLVWVWCLYMWTDVAHLATAWNTILRN